MQTNERIPHSLVLLFLLGTLATFLGVGWMRERVMSAEGRPHQPKPLTISVEQVPYRDLYEGFHTVLSVLNETNGIVLARQSFSHGDVYRVVTHTPHTNLAKGSTIRIFNDTKHTP